jgi:lipopolysaccharide export system permease protein
MLGIIALGLASVFSLLDLVDKIDDFVPGRLSIFGITYYVLLNLPKFFLYLLPMSLLICSLFIFSQASRNKEIVAIKANGGRLKILFTPFIILGLLFSLFAFTIGEIVVPDFSERALEFKRTYMGKGEKITFIEGTTWLRGTDGSIVRIELYIPEEKMAKGLSIFKLGEGLLAERIEAEEAVWDEDHGGKGIWKLRNAVLYDIVKGEVSTVSALEYPYLESPDLFSRGMRKPDEMGILELYHYTERLKAAGVKDSKLVVDFHSKVAYPLSNLFMLLLGLSLSVMGRIGGGLFSAGLGIFISFVYWLLYTLMLSMGYTRVIPPVLATWIVPMFFGAVATYLFSKIPE